MRIGSQGRALENQCVVAQSPPVGDAPWSPAVDRNRGAAGVSGPPDLGFPADGVLVSGTINGAGWVYAEVHLDLVAAVRERGAVLNFRHRPEQVAPDWHWNVRSSEVDEVSGPPMSKAAIVAPLGIGHEMSSCHRTSRKVSWNT